MNSICTLFPDTLWVRKEIKFGYSTRALSSKSWTRDTDSLHSCTRRARDGLSVSLLQDLDEKALLPKLDSYSHTSLVDSELTLKFGKSNKNVLCIECKNYCEKISQNNITDIYLARWIFVYGEEIHQINVVFLLK